ncbi:MAG: alpha/beta fold hydrolase [Pseudooceanicola nanhaiensis]
MVKQFVGAVPVRAWTGGTGASLIYLHGFEQHPGGAGFLADLAEDREVFAPEHPGYGESGGFEAMDGMLDVVLHYHDYLEPIVARNGPVDLVGHSLGGMFAAEIAAIHPHLVRRLVLVDSYGVWLDDRPQPDPFVILPDELSAAKWADPDAWAGKEPNSFDGETGAYEFYRGQNMGVASKFMWPVPDRGLLRRLGRIRADTLVLHGRQDGLIPAAYPELLAERIPNARLEWIEDAGHLPMIEAKDAFVSSVKAFLA